MVPSSGQRLELDGTEYTYRILDGRSLGEGHLLALKETETPKAVWRPERVRLESESGTFIIGEGEIAQRYQSKEGRQAALEAKKKRDRASKRRAKRASKPKPAPSAQPAPQPTAVTQQQLAAAQKRALEPAPQEVYERYEKEMERVVQRFCDAQDEFQRKIDHYKSLMKQGRRDEAKQFHEENIKNSSEYRKKLTAISHSYSNVYQRAIFAGVNNVQMQEMPALSDEYCK